jgi:15-cis-phytoene synthase
MHRNSQSEMFSTPADCAACRTSIRQGSQSFYIASLLLPVEIREPAYSVYAFCRMADDLIDRHEGGEAAISNLGSMLDRIYAGCPGPDFVERRFADVVQRFAIPREIPDALIEGLAWDAAGKRYETLEDLIEYAVRVAGTVGFMMTLVMDRRRPNVLARACDLGIAMQLTNIARDIGEDASNGRVYVPLSWLREMSIDPETWLARPTYLHGIRIVVERLLGEAERLYRQSLSGIAALPQGCHLGINVARLLYREIGREIARGVDPVAKRAVTSRYRKLRLVLAAVAAPIKNQPVELEPTSTHASFLINAVSKSPLPKRAESIPPWWDVIARSERMIDLLTAFSQRDVVVETASPRQPFLIKQQSDLRTSK